MGDDLLRAQGEQRRLARRQGERLVERVGVQGVRPAEHRGQGLDGGSDDVVVGLLGGQRDAGGLGVEAQLPRALVLGPESLAHDRRPELARGAVLGDLLEEVVVRVEEEGDARREAIHRQPRVDAVLHVLDAVAQRERQLLQRRRARLPDVVAAHGDGVPARDALGTEGEDVGHQAHRRPRRVDVLLLGGCTP